eukprot:15352511-Ditylum_brightwellii.AAC.1
MISRLQKSKRDSEREIASLRKQLQELDDWKARHLSITREHEQADSEKSLNFQKEKLRVDLEKKRIEQETKLRSTKISAE